MTRVSINFVLLFTCLCGIATGQTARSLPAPPPDSLFNEARYPADADFPYIYSLKELNITFEQSDGSVIAIMKYHVRMKVLNAAAPKASIVGIPYYAEGNVEQITSIRGITWQDPHHGIRLKPKDVRTINLSGQYKLKEFTMPKVESGSVVEYFYTIRRRYIEELPAFYLANQVPTVLSKISITYPNYLRYDAIIQNFPYPIQHKKIEKAVTDLPEIFMNPQPDPTIKEIWIARSIPAVQKEKFISTLDDYRGKISFQLSEFGIPRQPLENSWRYVVAEIRQKQKLFETIAKNKKAFAIGNSIQQAVSPQQAVLDSVFKFMLSHVKYNGQRVPFSSTDARAVLSGQEANQAAINQTLISMLRGAGIEAYPVLISTQKSGNINKDYPSFFQFNAQLVRAKIGNQTYLMDASFSYSQPNLIPVETYSQTGLLVKNQSFQWIELSPTKSVFYINVQIQAELQPNGTLTGHVTASFKGYPAKHIRLQKANGMDQQLILKNTLFEGYPKIELSNIRLTQLNNFHHPIEASADFTIPDFAVAFTRGLQFHPMVVGYLMSNPFKDKQRSLPITLNAPEKLILSYSIKLPKGYTLTENRQDKTIKLPGAVFKERYDISKQSMNYKFVINISKKHFKEERYHQLFNLYQRWVQLSRSQWFVK